MLNRSVTLHLFYDHYYIFFIITIIIIIIIIIIDRWCMNPNAVQRGTESMKSSLVLIRKALTGKQYTGTVTRDLVWTGKSSAPERQAEQADNPMRSRQQG